MTAFYAAEDQTERVVSSSSIYRRLWHTHLKFSFKPEMTFLKLEPRRFLVCSKKKDKFNVAYGL